MVRIVEPKAALDAEAVVVGRAVPAFDRDDMVVLNLVSQLAADAAIGADTVDFAVGSVRKGTVGIDQCRGHQGTGRTSLHAFAAGDAGTRAHGIVKVEDYLLTPIAGRHADHVVDLDLTAGAHTEIALYTGVQLHRHRRMAAIGRRSRMLWEAAVADLQPVGPLPQPGVRVVCDGALRLVTDQQLEHHLARELGARARRLDLHAGGRLAHAGGGEHSL